MGKASIWLSTLLSIVLFATSVAVLSIDRIESCLLEEIQKYKSVSNVKSPPIFHLHFGDPVVEIFNAINSSDIKRIKSLNKCVKLEDSSLFEDAT